jgi:hypothetical protein
MIYMYVKYIISIQRICVIFNFIGINDTSKDICRNFLQIQMFKLNIDVNVNTQYVFLLFYKPFFFNMIILYFVELYNPKFQELPSSNHQIIYDFNNEFNK